MSHNTNSSSPEIKPATHESTRTDTTQILSSDANNSATRIASNDQDNTSSPEIQPTAHESTQTDTNQILSSDANNTTDTSTSNKHGNASSSEIQPATPEPTPGLIFNPDRNNHHNSSSREIQPTIHESNQTSTTDPHANSEATTQASTNPNDTSIEVRKLELKNLINQELKYIDENAPKLGKHQEYLKKQAEDVSKMFKKIQEDDYGLKELKDVKKTVTKLKLQIPARYRTSDGSGQHKNQQSDGSAKSKGLHKTMPQFHNKSVFEKSPICKFIQERYEKFSTPELRLCLLCFSVFPENAIISRRLMVYWWIGEGFVPPIPRDEETENGKTAEDFANQYFNELMEKDFIEPVYKKPGCNVAICKMHPLIRAAVVTLADNVKFFDFDEDGNAKDFGKLDELGGPEEIFDIYPNGDPKEFFDFFEPNQTPAKTVEFKDKSGKPTQFVDMDRIENATKLVDNDQKGNATQPVGNVQKVKGAPLPVDNVQKEKVTQLLDHNGKPIETKFYLYRKRKTSSYRVCLVGNGLPKGLDWERLHMLFNVEDDILEFKPEWFLRMKNVNVVFLGRWQSSATHHIELEDLKFLENLENMKSVRFFSLQGVSRISELPESFANLKNLIVLDLRACHNLEKIPKGIGFLTRLTHLDMSECYLLDHMPKEISSLVELQVLKGFVVGDSPGKSSCTLEDLAKLPNLRKFSVYTRMKDFPTDAHLDALSKFKVLCKLTIAWGGHATQVESKESKPDDGGKKKDSISSKLVKCLSKKQWVHGSLRRQNAFRNDTIGSTLEKLDLKCFPKSTTPIWLKPENLPNLKKLYIRGGQFSDLGQFQDLDNWDEEADKRPVKQNWDKVEVLRLKYLDELEMDWREMQKLFPKLMYLEKVKCPKLTLFPCDESGLWMKKTAAS